MASQTVLTTAVVLDGENDVNVSERRLIINHLQIHVSGENVWHLLPRLPLSSSSSRCATYTGLVKVLLKCI